MKGQAFEPKTPIAGNFFLPNLSGDHSTGSVRTTPTDDQDLVKLLLQHKACVTSNDLAHGQKVLHYAISHSNEELVNLFLRNVQHDSKESCEYKRELKKCQHAFHKKCIDKWFYQNSENMSCPICRKNYNRIIDLRTLHL